ARLRHADNATITQLGGTDTQCDVAHVGVADLRVFLVGLVEVVADVPVEVAVGELEGTFQADIGVERLDVLLVDTRLLGEAVAPGDVTPVATVDGVVRVEVAVAAQQGVGVITERRAAAQREAGELLLGAALVVQRIGAERDAVAQVEAALQVEGGTGLRGQQVVVGGIVVRVLADVPRNQLVQRVALLSVRTDAGGARRDDHVIAQFAVRAAVPDLAVGRKTAVKRGTEAIDRVGRLLAIASHDRAFLDAGQAHHDVAAVVAGADRRFDGLTVAVTLVELADVGTEL